MLRILAIARQRNLPLLPALQAVGDVGPLEKLGLFFSETGQEESVVEDLKIALAGGIDAPASEMLGALEPVGLPAQGLLGLAQWLSGRALFRHHFFRAVAYPFSLMITILMIYQVVFCGLLMPFVSDRFKELYEALGATELPPLTSAWLKFNTWFAIDWSRPFFAGLYLSLLIVLCWLLWLIGKRLHRFFFALYLPLFGDYLRFDASRTVCTVLHTLLKNNVPLPEALRIAAPAVENYALRRRVRTIADRCGNGESFGDLVKKSGAFPAAVAFRLQTAYERCNLPDQLEAIAADCARHLQILELRIVNSARAISMFVAALCLIPVIWAVLAAYLPVFTLISNI